MKKVINITIGSIVFAIDEDAYGALASYLEQIKSNLKNSDDTKEIVDDVEIAIAEKFIARNRSEKLAVTIADVEMVIGELGSPVEFGSGESGEAATEQTTTSRESVDDTKKRLYRDPDDAVIAGVASGLANYFGIDPVVVRLIFVISFFFNGMGLLAYIILWLVVPVAQTTADRYAMRGEKVTLRDISQRVKKNIDDIEKFDYSKTSGVWSSFRGFLDSFFQVIGTVISWFIRVFRYLAGLAFILFGAFGTAGVVSAYSVILLSEKAMLPIKAQEVFHLLQSSALGITLIVSSFIVIVVPLIVSIIIGISLLTKRNYFTVQKSVVLVVVWMIAAVLTGTTGALQIEQVMRQVGSVEGRFDDSSFEVRWENGAIYGEDGNAYFIYEDNSDLPVLVPTSTATGTAE
jgi:phage shock protein PspC (stress-responsive transcriptional regulator)